MKELDEETYEKVQELIQEAAELIKQAWKQSHYRGVAEMLHEIVSVTV